MRFGIVLMAVLIISVMATKVSGIKYSAYKRITTQFIR